MELSAGRVVTSKKGMLPCSCFSSEWVGPQKEQGVVCSLKLNQMCAAHVMLVKESVHLYCPLLAVGSSFRGFFFFLADDLFDYVKISEKNI